MISKVMVSPKDVHILAPPSPKICDYVNLHDKQNFANVIKIRILRWIYHLRIPMWAQYDYKGPSQRKAGESLSEEM